jgi:hypothetical protein
MHQVLSTKCVEHGLNHLDVIPTSRDQSISLPSLSTLQGFDGVELLVVPADGWFGRCAVFFTRRHVMVGILSRGMGITVAQIGAQRDTSRKRAG